MLQINWNESIEDPVILADYIEMTITLDDDHSGFEFTYAHFVDYLQDVPSSVNYDGFLEGDDMDEAQPYFENAVALIESRRQWLGDLYPFSVQGNDVRLSVHSERSEWTPYVFLLACSHHDLIPRRSPRLETEFEKICAEAMKSLCNEGAEVFLFSRNSADRARLGGPAHMAVKNLASMLNTITLHEGDIPTTQREFGIDIIAIDNVNDDLACPLLMTAQCTVSGDPEIWGKKKTEPRWDREIGYFIRYDAPHTIILFIPHFPRLHENEWSVPPYHLNGCIVCDRYRICMLLQRHRKFSDDSVAHSVAQIVGDFIDRDGTKLSESNIVRHIYEY